MAYEMRISDWSSDVCSSDLAYEAARNKSHEWFNAAVEQEELSFERRIRLLADSALPDSRYRKEVHIDNHSLLPVNADTRIALLRIIQEAIKDRKSVGVGRRES